MKNLVLKMVNELALIRSQIESEMNANESN